MKNKPHKFRSHCPINFAQEVFGDKWSLLIIRDMMFSEKRHYGEFLQSEENISTNILASRLETLETHGLITKSTDSTNKSKFVYELTKKGKDLLPLMVEMVAWSAKYDEETTTPKNFIARYRKDRKRLLQELSDKIA